MASRYYPECINIHDCHERQRGLEPRLRHLGGVEPYLLDNCRARGGSRDRGNPGSLRCVRHPSPGRSGVHWTPDREPLDRTSSRSPGKEEDTASTGRRKTAAPSHLLSLVAPAGIEPASRLLQSPANPSQLECHDCQGGAAPAACTSGFRSRPSSHQRH